MKIGKNQYLFTAQKDVEGAVKKVEVGIYNLYLGEACNYYYDGCSILVLGYAIDATCPDKSLAQMCRDLTADLNKNKLGANITRKWNGRWIVFVVKGNKVCVWGDCCGLKQVFYDTNDSGIFASQARYIAEIKGYSVDKEAAEYLELAKQADKEYACILDSTLYSSIKRLLPNHFWQDGVVKRSDLSREKGTSEKAFKLIQNSIAGVNRLGRLAITLTAGWDSRLVLSGVDGCINASAVTLKYDWMSDDNSDLVIANELAKIKGIHHTILDCSEEDPLFRMKYLEHSEHGHPYWIQMAQAVRDGGYSEYFWVKGSCNEIIRNSFGILYDWQVNEKILCKLYSIPPNPYAKRILREWINGAKFYCRENNISILDLFYWEHRMGSWLAECLNEADVVGDMFTPFNCRVYLENGLAIKTNKRVAPDYMFFDEILKHGSFNVKNLPINANRYKSVKSKLKLVIKNNGHLLYGLILNRQGKKL